MQTGYTCQCDPGFKLSALQTNCIGEQPCDRQVEYDTGNGEGKEGARRNAHANTRSPRRLCLSSSQSNRVSPPNLIKRRRGMKRANMKEICLFMLTSSLMLDNSVQTKQKNQPLVHSAGLRPIIAKRLYSRAAPKISAWKVYSLCW